MDIFTDFFPYYSIGFILFKHIIIYHQDILMLFSKTGLWTYTKVCYKSLIFFYILHLLGIFFSALKRGNDNSYLLMGRQGTTVH